MNEWKQRCQAITWRLYVIPNHNGLTWFFHRLHVRVTKNVTTTKRLHFQTKENFQRGRVKTTRKTLLNADTIFCFVSEQMKTETTAENVILPNGTKTYIPYTDIQACIPLTRFKGNMLELPSPPEPRKPAKTCRSPHSPEPAPQRNLPWVAGEELLQLPEVFKVQ